MSPLGWTRLDIATCLTDLRSRKSRGPGNESQGREGVDNLRARKEKEGDRPDTNTDTNTGVERLEKVNPKWRKKERKKDIKKGFMSAARAQD
jgi:hypothetical protein